MQTIDTMTGPRTVHDSTAAGVSVEWDHNLPDDTERSAHITFMNLATGAQIAFEGTARFHHCFPLETGTYRVSLLAAGLQPYRSLVEARAGEVAHLRPLLEPHDAVKLELSAVLEQLGVANAHVDPRDLDVPARTTLVLDSSHPAYARDWQALTIADVDAAKRIIGVADDIWGVGAPRYGILSADDSADPAALAQATAREYIYGYAPSVKHWQDHINRQIFKESWSFSAFILSTVTINAGAVLVLNDASSFFVCRKLRMHITATLRITGRGPGLVQPLAYESFC
jgi:hypothetical protein